MDTNDSTTIKKPVGAGQDNQIQFTLLNWGDTKGYRDEDLYFRVYLSNDKNPFPVSRDGIDGWAN